MEYIPGRKFLDVDLKAHPDIVPRLANIILHNPRRQKARPNWWRQTTGLYMGRLWRKQGILLNRRIECLYE